MDPLHSSFEIDSGVVGRAVVGCRDVNEGDLAAPSVLAPKVVNLRVSNDDVYSDGTFSADGNGSVERASFMHRGQSPSNRTLTSHEGAAGPPLAPAVARRAELRESGRRCPLARLNSLAATPCGRLNPKLAARGADLAVWYASRPPHATATLARAIMFTCLGLEFVGSLGSSSRERASSLPGSPAGTCTLNLRALQCEILRDVSATCPFSAWTVRRDGRLYGSHTNEERQAAPTPRPVDVLCVSARLREKVERKFRTTLSSRLSFEARSLCRCRQSRSPRELLLTAETSES